MIDFDIQIDTDKLEALARGLTQEAAYHAWRRTLSKVSKRLKTHAARAMSQSVNFAVGVIKARLKQYQHGPNEAKVWAGLNPLDAARLGKAKQTSGGVKVGRYQFDNAWLKPKHPNGGVFRRVGAARFPIERLKVEWDEAASKALIALIPQVEHWIESVFEQEINYEFSKL